MSFATMHQVVQNLFDRITLVNIGKTERLTIDYNIRFHNFETNNDADSDQLVIIELKRDGNVYSPICSLLRDLHIHPTGFSKCCIGMVWTDPGLKHNIKIERTPDGRVKIYHHIKVFSLYAFDDDTGEKTYLDGWFPNDFYYRFFGYNYHRLSDLTEPLQI